MKLQVGTLLIGKIMNLNRTILKTIILLNAKVSPINY